MKRAMWWTAWVLLAGCSGSVDPVGRHEEAVVATVADVEDLGVDDAGCDDAADEGGEAVPVRGRPDLVGVLLDGAIVCVTTLDLATSVLDVTWVVDAQAAVPMSNGATEPEPQPYVEDGGEESGDDSEPEPQPYAKDDGHADDESDSPDSQ